jgi:uncharacterized Zn finger protein (UPF0148 family)
MIQPIQKPTGQVRWINQLELRYNEQTRQGESAIVRTFIPTTGPVRYKEHYLLYINKQNKKRVSKEVCRKSYGHENEPCVFCHRAIEPPLGAPPDTLIRECAEKDAFFVIDTRNFHPITNPDGKWTPPAECLGQERCYHCQQGQRPQYGGLKKFVISSTTSFTELWPFMQECAERCVTCGGKIQVHRFLCSDCKTAVNYNPDQGNGKIFCPDCQVETDVVTEDKCLNPQCANPKRASINDAYIKITRLRKQPAQNSPMYSFEFAYPTLTNPFQPLTETDALIKVPPLAKWFRPRSLEEQANLIGVPNPYAKRSATTSYTPQNQNFTQ